MKWLLRTDILGYASWLGLTATLLGLALTWTQARAAKRLAGQAKSAADLAAMRAEETRRQIRERLLVADVQVAITNLQTLGAIVMSPTRDNLLHVANALRRHINRTFREACTLFDGESSLEQLRHDLRRIWAVIDAAAQGRPTGRSQEHFLESLRRVEEFLAERADALTFQVLQERNHGP